MLCLIAKFVPGAMPSNGVTLDGAVKGHSVVTGPHLRHAGFQYFCITVFRS